MQTWMLWRIAQGQPYFKSVNYFLPANSTFMCRFGCNWIHKVSHVLPLRKCDSSEIWNNENHSFHNNSNKFWPIFYIPMRIFTKFGVYSCSERFIAFLWLSGNHSGESLHYFGRLKLPICTGDIYSGWKSPFCFVKTGAIKGVPWQHVILKIKCPDGRCNVVEHPTCKLVHLELSLDEFAKFWKATITVVLSVL
jgi:hypothetical protein